MLIAAHTIGCKLNFAEISNMLRKMVEMGHSVVDFDQKADLYIINTCTVTAIAEKKCRNAIRQATNQNHDAKVAVVGCFAQNAADEIKKIPGVTIILGNDKKHLLPEMIGSAIPQSIDTTAPESFDLAYSGDNRTRTFFKIQDGCDYFCTYCAIPFARGRSRSATIAETLDAASKIASSGAKEVVLTGVNTGTFGLQHNEHLIDLMKGLDQVEGIFRYRISSIEPNLLTNEIIDFISKSNKFLPHFHIPLQAGSDHVLNLMRRRYNTAFYREKLEYIKKIMPDACIAADVMTGFNGENNDEFARVYQYIESLPISYLHVFTYSERPNTAALRMSEKIPMHERRQHTARLLELSEKKHHEFITSQLGKSRPVLWECTNHKGQMHGWTDNYIRVARPYDESLINTIENVVLAKENIIRDE